MTVADRRATDESVYIRVFGGMGVDADGEPTSIGGPRQQKLLALLALRAGSVVGIDWLAEHLWDDDDRPQVTAPALRTYVSRLRGAFPEAAQSWIETVPSGYQLTAPRDAVEHLRFTTLRAAAKAARDREDPLAAQELLDEALDLWRGTPFRELEDDESARSEIEQLELDRLEMSEERWETALALGRHTQITGELAAFTSEHGLRDRAARQLALALHRSGRTPEALRVLARHRQTVVNETGLDPSPAVAELETALLAGDPCLDLEAAGRPLRGYQLIEEAGVGAFAVVWRARQPSVNRDVAIKQIRAELASQPEFIRRFEAEAHTVARIEHPHIVPLIDFWRDPESAYLVMRWLRGGTLEQRLDDGPLTLEETLVLAHQVGSALSAAHSHGVIHRDVKTGNILFDEAGHAFLSDFGIALEANASAGPEAALSPGSPAYSSPEQIRREPLGPEADVFSLGVVVFECLTGSLPFGAPSAEQLIERQLAEPYPLLANLRADVSTSVSDAVATATSKDPTERFASVTEFLAALEPSTSPVGERSKRPAGEIDNPYLGLHAFDAADAERFFGRERLVSELVGRLSGNTMRSRCVVVVGPSGSGKSSVVRAGLVPAIRNGAVPGSGRWFTTTMVPDIDPFEALGNALRRIAVDPPPNLLEQLCDGPRGILRGVGRCLPSDDDVVLLVIDQFEEAFVGESAEMADHFLAALAIAVSEPTSPLRLVVTMRADFYDRPLAHPTFAQVLKEAAVDVTPLAPDELEQAIVQPSLQQGVAFEPGLVARIAAEATGQSSPLPLLQYALSELFDRRDGSRLTADAFVEIGGLTGALAARAEATYLAADADQRAALRRTFGRMTDPSGGSADLRRRVPVVDVGDDATTSWVLDQLGRARLVTFDRDVTTREPTVEVAHEALLREWPRLAGWLREDADLLRSLDGLSRAATTWDEGGREAADLHRGGRLESALELANLAPDRLRPIDTEFVEASKAAAAAERDAEARRVRRLRRLVAAVAAALVIALLAGGLALQAQRRADREADAARAAAVEAEAQTRVAEAEAEQSDLATLISRSAALQGEDADVSVLLALEAHRRSPGPATEQAVLNALGSNDLPNRLSSLPPIHRPDSECPFVLTAPEGTAQFATTVDGTLISRDPLTGILSEHGRSPSDSCAAWIGNLERGFGIVQTADATRIWVGPIGGPWAEVNPTEESYILEDAFALDGRIPMIAPGERHSVFLRDASTGTVVGEPVSGGDAYVGSAPSADGLRWAVSFVTHDTPDPDGTTIIVDTATGEEMLRFTTEQPAARLDFDMEAGELVAATDGGQLITLDLDTGAVVADVRLPVTTTPLDIGIRPDSLITVVASGEVMVVDRHVGAALSTQEIRDVLSASYRPDGRLFTMSAGDERTGVLDLGGNALVRESWAIDPFASSTFEGGMASTFLPLVGTSVELIDLATGERTVTELETPAGDRFSPQAVHPDHEGFWAIDRANTFARWEHGEFVSRFDLGGAAIAGARLGDLLGHVWEDADGNGQASLIDLGAGSELYRVPVPGAVHAHPTGDGGVVVIDESGRVFRFDGGGHPLGDAPTSVEGIDRIAFDSTTGKLAAATGDGVVSMIDPETGETETLPTLEPIANLGFGHDGRLLVITGSDGTVRLWDVERSESAGIAWRGSGAAGGSPSWYDAGTRSMWVASSGRLLNIPLEPAQWIERACDVVGRDLSQDEWDRFVPGDAPRQSACGREIVDEPEAPPAGPTEIAADADFELATTMDFSASPTAGTFEITLGAEELGCSSGSVLEVNIRSAITNQFTCADGPRKGTFTISWQIVEGLDGPGDDNGFWEISEATGDFVDLRGDGVWSGRTGGGTGFGTFLGQIDFES